MNRDRQREDSEDEGEQALWERNSPMMQRRKRREKRRQGLFQFVFNIIQAVSIGVSTVHYSQRLIDHPWTIYNWFFFLITVFFFVLWFIARLQLGTHLTFAPRANRVLISTGLYAFFRHPIYYFGSLSLLSFCLCVEKFYWLWGFAFLLPMQCFRAYRETILLRKKFDDDYEKYSAQLWC